MSDILLAQPVLPEGYIDLSVGEPHLIRDNLLSFIPIQECTPQVSWKDFIYPSPCGNPELVAYLEDKHKAKVVITNGAKQALGAIFYALKKMKEDYIGMRNPYWALLPPLAEMHGVKPVFADPYKKFVFDSYLLLAPNNPDGWMEDLDAIHSYYYKNAMTLIHDAAYYTHNYIDSSVELKTIGDVQIFSISKMLGLSSLRVGYAVCQNDEMYNHIQHYMEHMTVGVSNFSQQFLLNIFKKLEPNRTEFETKCFSDLKENKKLAKTINPDVLKVPENVEDIPGMFLWAKCKNVEPFKKAKLHMIDGTAFGDWTHIRMNLGFTKDTMIEIVDRINSI